MKFLKSFNLAYLLVALGHIYALIADHTILIYTTKPLICIVLFVILFQSTSVQGKFKKRIFGGLYFALAGDVLLMLQNQNNNFFLLGLLAFLACHVFYIRAFHLDIKSNSEAKNPYFIWAAVILVLFCGCFYVYIRPHLGSMEFPVLLYCFVITLMVILAVGRFGRVNLYSFRLIGLGAFFFLLSDASLAYNLFVQPFPNASIVIMTTYIIAQYLIVQGAIARTLTVNETSENITT